MNRLNRYFVRLFPVLAFVVAACGGQSCSCLSPIKGGFPIDGRRHENALQVRVTQTALDYFQANGKQLVAALLPMGSNFAIPASCGGKNEVCCLNGMPQMCQLMIAIQAFALTPTPPNVLSFDVTTGLVSKDPIPITVDPGFGKAQCYFAIDTNKGPQGKQFIDLVSDLTFAVDMSTDLTSITLVNTKVNNLDPSMLDITPQPGFGNLLACGAANWGPIKGFIVSQLTKTLGDQIAANADNAFCAKCSKQDDCDGFADACTAGKCMRQGKCLQEIGASGKIDVGKLFANLSPGTVAGLDTLAVLGGYADVTPMPSSGLSLGMLGGGQGDPHSACVPMRPAPMVPVVPKWMEHDAATEPANGKPFHVGFGVHQSHLNTMAWGAFDGGALCLNIGTPSVALLDSKTLGVLMPSLADLTHSGDAPVFLAMRPGQEPQITLGAGTFNVDANGKKTIKEALLNISVPRFSIDFYIFVDERYVRVLTLTGDLAIPVGLDVDGMGRIVPLLGDLTKAFSNATVTHSELLAEPPEKLAKAFPMLLGLAVGQVGSVLKPLALPSVMGLNLDIVAIEPTDNLSFLSFFANLKLAAMAGLHVTTEAQVARVLTPPTAAFSVESGLDPLLQPRVELDLGGTAIDGSSAGLEWSVSFDDFTWSPYATARRLTVTDPTLWLQGRHHLLVRARMAGAPLTTDPDPVRLTFLVDTIAPTGTVEIAGDEARFYGTDAVSPAAALEYSVDLGAGWSPFSHDDHVTRAGGYDALPISVRVRDEAGNIGMLEFHGRTTTPATGGCGCTVGGRARDGGWGALGALALALGLAVRSRARRGVVPLALVAVLAACGLAASACNHDTAAMLGKGDLLDPIDEIGRYSDAVASGGVLHVSGYDDSLGDLAYAEIDENALSAPIKWQWVDGVPTDAAASTPGGYRKGIADPGDDIGIYTSLAVTHDGNPRIAYYDITNNQLKYASASGRVFTTSVVDKIAAGKSGLYTSLSLDAAGVPSIAYVAYGIPDGAAGFTSKLRLATGKTASPHGPGDWTVIDIDSTPIPCAGWCAKGEACIQTDPKDKTKRSTCKPVDAAPCPMMCGTGQTCIGAACVAYLAPVKAPDLLEGVGLFAQLLRLKSGSRAIVYYEHEQGDLKLAVENAPGVFATSFIDGMDPTTDVGQFCSARVAPDDTLHVAYVDAINDRLLYKTVKGTAAQMTPEVIDDGLRMDGPHPVGAGAALWTDGATVRVVYQDQQVADLLQAVRSGGAWNKSSAMAGNPGFGFYPHVVSDGAKLFLTEFVYDRAAPMVLGALQASSLK